MTRLAVTTAMLAASAAGGCFYAEPINQRPGIAINASGNQVYRGDRVELTASADDPENQLVTFEWRVYACTEGAGGADCDVEPFYTQHALAHAEFDVPLLRVGSRVPVRNVRVVLEGKDDLGATAKPMQELVITALDRPPGLDLARAGTFVLTPNRPVTLYATVSDSDDGPDALGQPSWEVFAPSQVAYDLLDGQITQNPDDLSHKTFSKTFVPKAVGDWEIRVTAIDPLDQKTTKSLMLSVVPPPPPCIAQVSPIVPPSGLALPITETTLFQVPVVIDDLDVYPPQTGLGVTKFQWSFQGPGASTHTPVAGATASSFQLDPASFTPGDIVEVRVEIYDRQLTPVGCPDGDATCSTISMASCIQRQTWRVEVR